MTPTRLEAGETLYAQLTPVLLTADAAALTAMSAELAEKLPVLAPMVGFDQRSPHHAYDLFTHTAYVVQNVPQTPRLRWAALLHDIGKVPTYYTDATGRGHFPNHAHVGSRMAQSVLREVGAAEADAVCTLIDLHMTVLPPDPAVLRQYRDRLGLELLHDLLELQQADNRSKGGPGNPERFRLLRELIDRV